MRELKGKEVTYEMLKQLYDNVIIKDFINLNGNISKGYLTEIAAIVVSKISTDNKDAKIVVMNDLGFQMYKALSDIGFKKENILLAYGKWNKDGSVSEDKKVYNIMRMFAESNFVEFENDLSNVITLEEMFSMGIKFDYIISNPPYAIGNEITKAIIDNVDFDTFINLMPISDYKKKDLYKHIQAHHGNVIWEGDAKVLPHICSLKKEDNNSNSLRDFLFSTAFFECYKKYILSNVVERTPFQVILGGQGNEVRAKIIDYKHNFFIPTFNYKVYRAGNTYECNVLNNNEKLIAFIDKNDQLTKGHGSTMYTITQLSETERNNLSNWYYNSSFIEKVLPFIMKCDIQVYELIPRVDWSHPWTDEEILRDYGYTDAEIKEILS